MAIIVALLAAAALFAAALCVRRRKVPRSEPPSRGSASLARRVADAPRATAPLPVEPEDESPVDVQAAVWDVPADSAADDLWDEEDDDDRGLDRFASPRAVTPVPSATDDVASELRSDPGPDVGDDAGPAPAGTADGAGLQRRTPKAGGDSSRTPMRMNTSQRRSAGANRRSPDQVRSLLRNYRRGVAEGRAGVSSADDEVGG